MKFSELELDDGSQLCLKLSQLRLMDLQLEGRVAKKNPLIQKQRKGFPSKSNCGRFWRCGGQQSCSA